VENFPTCLIYESVTGNCSILKVLRYMFFSRGDLNRWSTILESNVVAVADFKQIQLCPNTAPNWNVSTVCGKYTWIDYKTSKFSTTMHTLSLIYISFIVDESALHTFQLGKLYAFYTFQLFSFKDVNNISQWQKDDT
jgi:hypothetical protein